jgi:hypothetical protein
MIKISLRKKNPVYPKSFLPESFLLDEAIIHDIKKKMNTMIMKQMMILKKIC